MLFAEINCIKRASKPSVAPCFNFNKNKIFTITGNDVYFTYSLAIVSLDNGIALVLQVADSQILTSLPCSDLWVLFIVSLSGKKHDAPSLINLFTLVDAEKEKPLQGFAEFKGKLIVVTTDNSGFQLIDHQPAPFA